MNKTAIFSTLVVFLTVSLIVSCGNAPDQILYVDQIRENLTEFHRKNIDSDSVVINRKVDLFVDYSTCVKEASSSSFYKSIHPKILDLNPEFWSIKGSQITKEDKDTYTLLNSITEVSYADIKGAVDKITSGNNQAILITDGEFYVRSRDEDNYNNPYLTEGFTNWLKKGNDIYIYAEPYKERGIYDKYRYYMLFTNHILQNNIFNVISESAKISNAKLVKLSNSDWGIEVVRKGEYKPQVNSVLAINENYYFYNKEFEFQEYQIDWTDIVKYIKNAPDSITGGLDHGGDYFLKGIFLKQNLEYFKISELDIRVYNVFDAYRSFEDTSYTEKTNQVTEVSELFTYDEEAFKNNGEVILKIHDNFSGHGLNQYGASFPKFNLLRVDIILKSAESIIDEADLSIFKWKSIDLGSRGLYNESVLHSIKNTLEKPELNPINVNNGLLYSIYISTFPSNL